MRISDWSSDVCSSDLLTSAGIELCKSLQHRVAADTQATKIIEKREAEEAPAEGNVSGADGASLNGDDDHARQGSPGNFVRTRRRTGNPSRVASRFGGPLNQQSVAKGKRGSVSASIGVVRMIQQHTI